MSYRQINSTSSVHTAKTVLPKSGTLPLFPGFCAFTFLSALKGDCKKQKKTKHSITQRSTTARQHITHEWKYLSSTTVTQIVDTKLTNIRKCIKTHHNPIIAILRKGFSISLLRRGHTLTAV